MKSSRHLRARFEFALALVGSWVQVSIPVWRLKRLAGFLEQNGDYRAAMWCRRKVLQQSPGNHGAFDILLSLYLQHGRYKAAESLATSFRARNGLTSGRHIWLAGEFFLGKQPDRLQRMMESLLDDFGDSFPSLSPSIISDRIPSVQVLLTSVRDFASSNSKEHSSIELAIHLARLCFSFRYFETSLVLYRHAAEDRELEREDRIAAAYAAVQSGSEVLPGELIGYEDELLPDWHLLLATVMMSVEDVDRAKHHVEFAVRGMHGEHPELTMLVKDCLQIVEYIADLDVSLDDNRQEGVAEGVESGILKVFVSGFGWSGSGALYDALKEYDCFTEFPEIEPSHLLNMDAGSEMTFIQGPAGLGHVWRHAREHGMLDWLTCWELFRLHLIGGGYSGYAEHKATLMTRNLVREFGARYIAVFRRFFQALHQFNGTEARLLAIFQQATEGLCELLPRRDGDCVLLNNVVFGRNADMFEIFSNFKAAVVRRDPRDVYADRKTQDRNHWRSPLQFIEFYSTGLRKYRRYQDDESMRSRSSVREISFERFVQEDEYREEVIEWLLDGKVPPRTAHCFFPEQSARNIGLHQRELDESEQAVFRKHADRLPASTSHGHFPGDQ